MLSVNHKRHRKSTDSKSFGAWFSQSFIVHTYLRAYLPMLAELSNRTVIVIIMMMCRLVFLQVSMSPANLLTSSYFFFDIHCVASSIHVLLGRPLVLFPSNFPSRTSKALKPLEPHNTCPPYANFLLHNLVGQ